MTAFVDVTYRGLRVAHKAKMTPLEAGVFVEHETPLPVGSPLVIFEEGQPERPGHVVHVVEHEAGAGPAGMKIVWGAADLARPVAKPVAAEPVAAAPAEAEPAPAAAPAEPAAAAAELEPEPDASGSMDAAGSPDASGDGSDDGGADKSSDGNGAPGGAKKQKKGKKRR